jgi:SAM-dependent methyltransferase
VKQINDILKEVEDYYSNKIREHGVSAKGVDWNSEASQELRFLQLLKVIKTDEPFSLLDYGCGYGALLDFMKNKFPAFEYLGFDISKEMIARAEEGNPSKKGITWTSALGSQICDYSVASGIFNVKLNQEELLWKEYVEDVLIEMDKRSNKGFSFNMLTKYSDKEYMREYLFYADPMYYFDYCKRHFSKYVALLHDYPLYEFTIIVKK